MFKALSPSVCEEMEKVGDTVISIKAGWEQQGDWQAKPANISYWLGQHHENIFTCYYSQQGDSLQITNVEPTSLIGDKKGLVDAYLYIAIKGLIRSTKALKLKRLIVDSHIPAAADHMLELGFYVTAKGLSAGARGNITFEET